MNPLEKYKSIAREGSEAAAQCLLRTFDLAIEANIQRDRESVLHCLELLRRTLDFNADPQLAHRLTLVYQDCESALDENRFEAAGEILETVRGLWNARLKLEKLAESGFNRQSAFRKNFKD